MGKPWWVDLLTIGVVVLWMGWTFTTMQEYGPSLNLLVAAVAVGIVGILVIYGQRLTYLRVGDWLVVGARGGVGEQEQDEEEWEKHR